MVRGLLLIGATCFLSFSFGLPAKADEKTSRQDINLRQLLSDRSLKSHGGRDITISRVSGTKPDETIPSLRFLLQSGLHPNEELPMEFVAWMRHRFQAGASPLNHLNGANVSIDFLQVANPDGRVARSRYNQRGVNLNRNFGTLWGITREEPGPKKFSEPETRAIRQLLESQRYSAAVDVHGYINWLVLPSSPDDRRLAGEQKISPAAAKNYHGWRRAVESESRHLPSYEIKTAGGLGDGGAFEDWAFWQAGTFAVCLEMASDSRFQATSSAFAWGGPSLRSMVKSQRDMFYVYERFLSRIFQRAIDLTLAQDRSVVQSK